MVFFFPADLHIGPEVDAPAHDEQVSLGISRAESLLTESQEAGRALQEDQSGYAICHSTCFLSKQHRTGREIGSGPCGAINEFHRVLKNKTNSCHTQNDDQIVLCGIINLCTFTN